MTREKPHLPQRRTFLCGLGGAAAAVATGAWAQRPAQPIARPRPIRPLVPGRFTTGGVASGPLPGLYVVVEVDAKGETLHLRDESGRTGAVRVREDLFDIATLQPGDQVEVDFLVPDPGTTQLEAGGLWKVQR